MTDRRKIQNDYYPWVKELTEEEKQELEKKDRRRDWVEDPK